MRKLTLEPELKKYYIGIGLLGILVAAVIAMNVFGSYLLKGDYELEKSITTLQTSIDNSVPANRKLPDTPLDIGVKDTQGIEYKKVNKSKYALCATFRTKSDGYVYSRDYSDAVIREGLEAGANLSNTASYTDGNTEGLKHEKGYACIVYEPYQLTDAYSKQYLCGGAVSLSANKVYSTAPIVAVDVANMKISLDPPAASAEAQRPSSATNYPGGYLTQVQVAANTPMYDESCSEIRLSSLKVGDSIQVYTDYYNTTRVVALQKTASAF